MSFALSEEHEAFRKVVRDFAEKALQPNIERWESEGGLPSEAVRGMGELGLFGLTAARIVNDATRLGWHPDYVQSCKAATAFNKAGGRMIIGLAMRREMGDASRIGEGELCVSGL